MRIIICGDGQYTLPITLILARVGVEVIVITKNSGLIHELEIYNSIRVLIGDPCEYSTWHIAKANIECSAIIATTDNDEKNMIICHIVYSLFNDIPRRVALISNKKYNSKFFKNYLSDLHIPVTHTIEPESIIANIVKNTLSVTNAHCISNIFDDIYILLYKIKSDMKYIINKNMSDLNTILDGSFCVGILDEKNIHCDSNKNIISDGNKILILCKRKDIQNVIHSMNNVISAHNYENVIAMVDNVNVIDAIYNNISIKNITYIVDKNIYIDQDNEEILNNNQCISGDISDENFISSITGYDSGMHAIFGLHLKDISKNIIGPALYKNSSENITGRFMSNINGPVYQKIALKEGLENINLLDEIFNQAFKGINISKEIKAVYKIKSSYLVLIDIERSYYNLQGAKVCDIKLYIPCNDILFIMRKDKILNTITKNTSLLNGDLGCLLCDEYHLMKIINNNLKSNLI